MLNENQLRHALSPYLLQHKDNPVAWHMWGDEAFETARRDGKPILLSIGYAACHWCHVMAHESFEDPVTASLMNALFVNIKLDREERPDLDHLYMTSLQMMGEQGGWPMTMFLSADAILFYGGTYFPPESRYGRPSFCDVLRSISAAYNDNARDIGDYSAKMRSALQATAEIIENIGFTMPSLLRAHAILHNRKQLLVTNADKMNENQKNALAKLSTHHWRIFTATASNQANLPYSPIKTNSQAPQYHLCEAGICHLPSDTIPQN